MQGRDLRGGFVALGAIFLGACAGEGGARQATLASVESCMTCHNGATTANYTGPGLENPHPFGTGDSASLSCTSCHGGNGASGGDKDASHVPPPPEIGDRNFQDFNRLAYFNRLTLSGMDQFDDYTVNGITYSALDFLQFINPGDLRVIEDNRSCGACHTAHSEAVLSSMLATESGMFSGGTFAAGLENQVPESVGRYQDTAADLGFRAVADPSFQAGSAGVGAVSRLLEFPVFSQFGVSGSDKIFNNQAYAVAELQDDQNADNSIISDSALAHLYQEQLAFTCGDCHLGSAGANNRYGDFRSSGCSACHMPYSLDGRSRTGDPNVNTFEPLNPDNIRDPEQPHPKRHLLVSVAKTLPSGEAVQGMDDYTCAGCHQGSNRTVMQFWGIRLDQNQDLRRRNQYPADPVSFRNSAGDTRLFDPVVGNNTFNGRNANQYIVFEDYDGDGRDDTPADVHYEAGMGCIDCHGSFDLHGDTSGNSTEILSRMEQGVGIRCESCHGSVDSYAATMGGSTFTGISGSIGVDSKGNALDNVYQDAGGDYYLVSRLTGARHYIPQTKDTVVDNGRLNPLTNQAVYSSFASYAMGTADGDPSTGIGPQQTDYGVPNDFNHTRGLDCASCHSAWTNTCTGCHLGGEYTTNNNNFSNITGERIVFRQANADFVYQSPLPFQLGIGQDDKVSNIVGSTDVFFQYDDLNGDNSGIFSFSDRNGAGNSPFSGNLPAMSHNAMMQHSIRGRVTPTNEGARNCVACHLTTDGLAAFGAEYDSFRTAMALDDFASLDFNLLQEHFGRNPGNQLNSPLWVHAVAGLGSGLYLFDANGAAVNPLDDNANRVGSGGVAPKDSFDLANVAFNLDRMVQPDGSSNASSNHPMSDGIGPASKRDGAANQNLTGPLGQSLIDKLTDPINGVVLDAWIDADGVRQGNAADYVD